MYPEPSEPAVPPSPTPAERLVAFLEVLICSDFPTQLAIGASFAALGYGYGGGGRTRLIYVVGVSLIDTVVLVALIVLFLRAHGESPREVILGRRPPLSEAVFGLPLIGIALAIALAVLYAIQLWAPSLRTVPQNPLEQLFQRPSDAWLFALVSIAAGGVREEVQRAFLLHRFEIWLGGGTVGLVVTSVAFGVGHLIQGLDAAVATGLLGAFWGATYLRRRSAVAPMISHAGFDLLQIAQFMRFGR